MLQVQAESQLKPSYPQISQVAEDYGLFPISAFKSAYDIYQRNILLIYQRKLSHMNRLPNYFRKIREKNTDHKISFVKLLFHYRLERMI